ncbi:MAG: hypothetical protein NVSMB25_11530 [Thermoleophilaceae bacterium]
MALQSPPAPLFEPGLERARDRLAAALFAAVAARRAARMGRESTAWPSLAEAALEVDRAEAWLSLLERPERVGERRFARSSRSGNYP